MVVIVITIEHLLIAFTLISEEKKGAKGKGNAYKMMVVLESMNDEFTTGDMKKKAFELYEIPAPSVDKSLKMLVDQKLISKVKHGVYAKTEEFQDYLKHRFDEDAKWKK